MDEIDRNAALSSEDKQHRRYQVMADAFADFEESNALVRAREAARQDAHPVMIKALEQAEVGWDRAMNKIAERAGRSNSF